jgi:hypothetical protein
MILAHRTGLPSAKLLRNALLEETGVRYLVTTRPERIRKLHLRYGSSACVNCADTEFNDPSFIDLVSHKLSFANEIQGKFETPIFIRNRVPTDDEFPIVIRQTMTGWGGKGIVMCPDREVFDSEWNGEYWTRFVRTIAEYRVHVLGDKIGRLFKKVPIPIDDITPPEVEFPIRTLKSGNYRYSLRNDPNSIPSLTDLVTNLSKEVNGKFYALDVGKLSDNDGWFIFEANSAPGINQFTAIEYAKYLIEQGAV